MTAKLKSIYAFYRDGFREMRVGRTLWLIILVKLFIMFAVLKLFFFRDPMAGQSDEERAMTVMENISLIDKQQATSNQQTSINSNL